MSTRIEKSAMNGSRAIQTVRPDARAIDLLLVIGLPRIRVNSHHNHRLRLPFWNRSEGYLLDVLSEARACYHRRALAEHPDKGGNATAFALLTVAWRQFKSIAARRGYEA